MDIFGCCVLICFNLFLQLVLIYIHMYLNEMFIFVYVWICSEYKIWMYWQQMK